MINDYVPQIVEQYINHHKENIYLDIITLMNGRIIDSDSISRAIQDELASQLKF